MKTRWISLLLVFVMVLSLLPLEAKAAVSGTCGDNLTWTLADGTLTISGTGKMDDYSTLQNSPKAPWYDCIDNIRSIILSQGITHIGCAAFSNCYLVKSIDIPDSVTHINHEAFYNCLSLTSVNLSDSLISIGQEVFFNCPIDTLSIPDSLSDVHDNTFDGIKHYTKIIVGSNNTALATDAAGVLYNKEFTRVIRAPSGSIGAQYTIPNTVKTIGPNAFRNCENLWRITVPDGVTEIGNWAFGYCTSLLSISLPETLTTIGSCAFAHCSSLTGITIPGSVTSMGTSLLSNCTALESALLSDGLTRIEGYMFRGCTALRSIVIPVSVSTVSSHAFYGCSNLANVYYQGTRTQWDKVYISEYNECLTNATLHFLPPENERPGKEPDRWSFSNSVGVFGLKPEGYYITNADYQKLLSSLSETDIEWVTKAYRDEKELTRLNVDGTVPIWERLWWEGSCYGMSAWVCLASQGLIDVSAIDGKTQSLAEYTLTPAVESAINFYHVQQRTHLFQNYIYEYKQLAQVAQLEDLQVLGQHANATGEAFMLGYEWYESFHLDGTCKKDDYASHTVVGYGWEKIEPVTYTVNDATHTYNYRILIYNCSYPNQNGEFHLYYNDSGIWCIPGEKIISTNSQTADTKYNNGKLLYSLNYSPYFADVDYNTRSADSTYPFVSLETDPRKEYTLHWDGGTATISGFSVESDNADHGITVILDSGDTESEEASYSSATALIPISGHYTIESASDTMSFRLHNNDRLINAHMQASGQISFSSDGSVSLTADAATTYSLSVVVDEGVDNLPWSKVCISGDLLHSVSATRDNNGILLQGDDLSKIDIYATDGEGGIELNAASSRSSVLITEASGKLVVCEDSDDNGTYETQIAESLPFTDVPVDAFYHDAVRWAVENNITNGLTATEFGPTATCNRAQVVTFLWRAAGCPEPTSTENPFVDVQSGSFYEKPVLWAVEKGITNGADATHFNPTGVCNRAQVVTFLYRAFESPAVSTDGLPFIDVPAGSWYEAPIAWAVENGITNGLSATEFGPDASCNRAQVVTFLYRAYN